MQDRSNDDVKILKHDNNHPEGNRTELKSDDVSTGSMALRARDANISATVMMARRDTCDRRFFTSSSTARSIWCMTAGSAVMASGWKRASRRMLLRPEHLMSHCSFARQRSASSRARCGDSLNGFRSSCASGSFADLGDRSSTLQKSKHNL